MTLTVEEKSYWQSKGFVLGAQVRHTGTSWNASTSSRKWIGVVGVIVPGARSKSKGIHVQFTRPENQFPEVFVYHPTNLALVETKMPSAPKAEPSLYKAIRERLETKDRETLHDRTTKAVEAVEDLLEGVQTVEDRAIQNPEAVEAVENLLEGVQSVEEHPIQNPEAVTPWSLEGRVVDPDPKDTVGKAGWFWDDDDRGILRFGIGADSEDSCRTYESIEDMPWDHFAYLPDFPGAEILKRTTGYEAPKA